MLLHSPTSIESECLLSLSIGKEDRLLALILRKRLVGALYLQRPCTLLRDNGPHKGCAFRPEKKMRGYRQMSSVHRDRAQRAVRLLRLQAHHRFVCTPTGADSARAWSVQTVVGWLCRSVRREKKKMRRVPLTLHPDLRFPLIFFVLCGKSHEIRGI